METIFDKPLDADVAANSQAIAKIGKLLYSETLSATSPSTTNIPDLSKYNIFVAKIASGFSGGPCIGLRYSATDIRFFGTSLASGGAMAYTLANMIVSGDNFTGWDTGTYGSKWGANATGIRDIYGIC